MRVALYCPSIGAPGCPERTIREIVARSRHEWLVFTRRYEAESTFADLRGAPIVEVPRARRLPLADAEALVVFSSSTADLVNLSRYRVPVVCFCFTPLRAAFDADFRNRYLMRAGWDPLRCRAFRAMAAAYRALDRGLWTRYDRVFAISDEVRQRIGRAGLRAPEDVSVLHPGVDTERFQPARSYEREFVVPGRITWHKNIELAIDAFRLLLARRPNLSDFRLTIAGTVDSSSREYAAGLRVRAAGCPQIRILEAPSQDRLHSLCKYAYSVVLPQFSEGWGLLALEAMALRRPVIALNRGGCNEIVAQGETGLLVDATPEAVGAAMEFLADNPMLVRTMGANARARASRFDWRFFCSELDQALEQLTGAPQLSPMALAAS